jgi:L-ornithine Nalpha-acyltransferase
MVALQNETGRPVDVRAGDLQIRLAESAAELRAAQTLRYQVFVEEMKATPSPEVAAAKREFDRFDDYCDHVMVLDRSLGKGADAVIGTYRVMRRGSAVSAGGFYSATEYDIATLMSYPGQILELGRSCVRADYRTGATMQLLWRGIAEYVLHYDIELLFGCASLHGTKSEDMALPLSYLFHHHLAPPALRPRALPERYVDMNLMPADAVDRKRALAALPPLIKGYLRLGGFVGDGAVIDYDFNTTDVSIVVKTDLVTERYFKHYTSEDGQKP